MVRPERFELPTCCSGGNRSIQLSYGRNPMSFSLHAQGRGINVNVAGMKRADTFLSAMQHNLTAKCADRLRDLEFKPNRQNPGRMAEVPIKFSQGFCS